MLRFFIFLWIIAYSVLGYAEPNGALPQIPKPSDNDQDEEEALDPNRYEINTLPVLLADTDRGFILGGYGVIARFAKGYEPFRWRLKINSLMSVERQANDKLQLPFHHHAMHLDLPAFYHPRLRVELFAAFRRYEDTGYYGMGNRSDAHEEQTISRFNEYEHTNPGLSLQARWRYTDTVGIFFKTSFAYNWMNVLAGSRLERDKAEGSSHIRSLLNGLDDHPLFVFNLGWLWDSRDHEFVPTRGSFHEMSWRFSPGPNLFGGINLTSRVYFPLWKNYIVFGGRIVGDILFGDVPIYELARVGGLTSMDAIGGQQAIRGVPLQRYHGKLKLFANAEVRFKVLPFSLLSNRFNLGAVLFADMGRVWADIEGDESLDGSGLGLKYGLGSGLRLQWGETFIFRADLAYSPDADPIGGYLGFSHIF